MVWRTATAPGWIWTWTMISLVVVAKLTRDPIVTTLYIGVANTGNWNVPLGKRCAWSTMSRMDRLLS